MLRDASAVAGVLLIADLPAAGEAAPRKVALSASSTVMPPSDTRLLPLTPASVAIVSET